MTTLKKSALKKGTLVRLAALILISPFAVWILFFTDFSLFSRGEPPAPAISDRARILGSEQMKSLAEFRASLKKDFGIDLVIITVPGRVDVVRQAAYEFEMARVGSAGEDGRGVLLLIAPGSNTLRLEVSQALEGIYREDFAAAIQQQMAPFFRDNLVADGILAITARISERAAEAEQDE